MIGSNDARMWVIVAALAALGCDGGTPGTDSGRDPVDGAGSTEDGGTTPSACATMTATAASTVGCNGGFVAAPAANAPGGRCTPGGDAMPAGTCTTEMTTCMGDMAGTGMGFCTVFCMPPASSDIDTSTCPTGFRCFKYGTAPDTYGLCRRDCDATHECGAGFECTAEGSCAEASL